MKRMGYFTRGLINGMNKLKSSSPLTLKTHFIHYKPVNVLIRNKKKTNNQLKYLSKNIYSSSESESEEKSLKLSLISISTFLNVLKLF